MIRLAAVAAVLWAALTIGTGCAGTLNRAAAERAAMACAVASEGTDSAIVQCFTDRGLAAPEDLT